MVQNESSTQTSKTKKGRSPAYPGITLEEAINKAEVIRKEEGKNEAYVDTILAHWGYKPKSGAGLVALSALIKFGLMNDKGSGENRKAQLTDLALKILFDERPESEERLALIREAALTPTIHKELWEKYQGNLPSDMNLRYLLRSEKGFLDQAVDAFLKDFRKTLAFSKLEESANISQDNKVPPKQEKDPQLPPVIPLKKEESEEQKTILTMKEIQIPYAVNKWAKLVAEFPMSEEDWAQMKIVLDAMKLGLVKNKNR